MQGLRHQLFAGPRLTQYQHSGICWRHLFNDTTDLQHTGATGYNTGQWCFILLTTETTVFVFQLIEAIGPIDDQLEHVGVNRFIKKIVGAHCNRLRRVFAIIITSNNNNLGMRSGEQNFFQQGKAYRRSVLIRGQTEIQGNNRRLMLLQDLQRSVTVTGNLDIVSLETPAQLGLQPGIIFNNQ